MDPAQGGGLTTWPGAAAAFHQIAPAYDAQFTDTAVGKALRNRVWTSLDASFSPGQHVLDLGCGTGSDAVHLAGRGVRVTAVDAAPAMAALTLLSARGAIMSEQVRVAAARAEALPLAESDPRFDGAYANFGVLNCIADLPALGRTLAARLRPGAALIAVVMGPLCAGEVVFHLAHGDAGKAFRRLRRGGAIARMGGHAFPVYYPSPWRLARHFSPTFQLEDLRALGVVLPPPSASGWLDARPGLRAGVTRADAFLGCRWAAAYVADHYIATLRRREQV